MAVGFSGEVGKEIDKIILFNAARDFFAAQITFLWSTDTFKTIYRLGWVREEIAEQEMTTGVMCEVSTLVILITERLAGEEIFNVGHTLYNVVVVPGGRKIITEIKWIFHLTMDQ